MYIIRKNKKGEYYFILTAANGLVLVESYPYASLSGVQNGIESVKRNVNSEIKDETKL